MRTMPAFTIVLRGDDEAQVDEHVPVTGHRIAELERALAAAEGR